ncbi:hypothetical protein, partial [Paenibacillus dendritiformis]|uniref:hypothetical protein n=1 Tax=Paenibacillus dendritiformis TaxID=130049 RepID=UPI000DAFF068
GTHSVLIRFFLLRDEIHHIKNEVPKNPLDFLNSLKSASFVPQIGATSLKGMKLMYICRLAFFDNGFG